MGVDITLENARTQIENAICDALMWAYGFRLPPVADIATLRATPSISIQPRYMRVVTLGGSTATNGYAWMWKPDEMAADDGLNFVQPADVAAGMPGRWALASPTGVTSQSTTGYLQKSENYNDDSADLDVFMQRMFGNAPAVLLSYDRTDREHKSSGVVGGIDWCRARFTLFAVSFNPRGQQTARQGSPVASEAAVDPGTGSILGDAMVALKGAALGINDVAYVEVGDEYPVIKDLARSRFVDALELTVYYTETLPDPTVRPLSYPHTFNATYKFAGFDQSGALDTANNVTTSGLQFALGDGLTQSFAGGTVNVNGAAVAVAGAAKTFAPNAITYRDVDATGALFYSSTNYGDPQPALAFGRVRLGLTATDATGVRLDRILAASLVQFGDVDQYDQPTPIASLTISPDPMSIPHGTPFQYTVTGTDADSNTRDVTDLVTWTTDDNGDTVVQPDGVATKASAGTAHVTASLNGIAKTATLTAT